MFVSYSNVRQIFIPVQLTQFQGPTKNFIFDLPYFSIDNAHLMYNAHPKLFCLSYWCIDNARDAN
jgi:hypothetical protein